MYTLDGGRYSTQSLEVFRMVYAELLGHLKEIGEDSVATLYRGVEPLISMCRRLSLIELY